MTNITQQNNLLSGFGTDNILEGFYVRPGVESTEFIIASENEDEFKLEAALPGFEDKDVNYQIGKSKITLESSKTLNENDSNNVRSFKQTVFLPENTDESSLQTKFEDGMLTITVPKAKNYS